MNSKSPWAQANDEKEEKLTVGSPNFGHKQDNPKQEGTGV